MDFYKSSIREETCGCMPVEHCHLKFLIPDVECNEQQKTANVENLNLNFVHLFFENSFEINC